MASRATRRPDRAASSTAGSDDRPHLENVDLARIVSLAEFEPFARERMSEGAYHYVAGGSWDEVTLGESLGSWARFRFVPRVLRDIRQVDVSGMFLSRRAALPIAVAPMIAQAMALLGASSVDELTRDLVRGPRLS